LSLATQIAEAVADLHSIDGDQPSIAHNDIIEDNILFTPDERPVLHDFNLGVLVMMKKNVTNITTCAGETNVLRDIAQLGNLFFVIVTGGKRPWASTTPRLRKKLREKGVHDAPLPDKIENSSDPAMQALVKAYKACYRNAKERPSAPQVVAFLQNKTSTI
jgi:serine/threonine protein kinase